MTAPTGVQLLATQIVSRFSNWIASIQKEAWGISAQPAHGIFKEALPHCPAAAKVSAEDGED